RGRLAGCAACRAGAQQVATIPHVRIASRAARLSGRSRLFCGGRPAPFRIRFPMSTSPAPQRLRIALRKSALSLCHAEYIRARLLELYPSCEIVLRGITTQGDRVQDRALADIGGKGLFI